MAVSQSNARLRPGTGTPTSGVIHVRTRLDADFTVISNDLAQRPGSAVTVGVAVYIASLPDGTRISIDNLCRHFDEGEILISRALGALEAAGYLERRRERHSDGRIRTRTYFYDVPGGGIDPDGPPEPPSPTPPRPRTRKATRAAAAGRPALAAVSTPAPVPPEPQPEPQAQPESESEQQPQPQPQPQPEPEPEQPVALTEIDPQVLAVLTSLRRVDPRLELFLSEAARIAPAISRWLAAGVSRVRIVSMLTEGLPDHFLGRPVGILAYRLRQTPLPLPPAPAEAPSEGTPAVDRQPLVHPIRNCDGCDRGFRAPESVERCRDCRSDEPLPAAC